MHPKSPEEAFGLVLRTLRQKNAISQEELAAKGGYHRTYIGMLERGEKSPSLRTVFALAACLGTEPSKLLSQVERALTER